MQDKDSVEIERKFLVKDLPSDLESYDHKEYEQGYLSVNPVVRIRREGDVYVLTYKGGGLLKRTEYNMPLTKEAYYHLREKADGYIISKCRYVIPLDDGHRVELDIFKDKLSPLVMAEVEFLSEDEAKCFKALEWFGREVTYDSAYHNSTMSRDGLPKDFKRGEENE